MGKDTGFIEYAQQANPYRDARERVEDFDEFIRPLNEEDRVTQAARCMDCGVPFCHSSYGCPVDNLIPEWNHLVYLGRWKEAYVRLRKTNNFPEITGRVCPAPCQSACVLGINDDPVTIKDIEYAIAEKASEEGWLRPAYPQQRSGKTVAIVGSGPAGLAAAEQLNEMGHSVTVFERSDRIGGLLMYGIPNMKLDKKLLEKRWSLMEKAGIVFKTGVSVGENLSADEVVKEYDAILLACGATVPRDLPVKGREKKGIHFAMDFLRSNTKSLLDSNFQDKAFINAHGKHVIVIGGGDTGNDCIGTSVRHGAASICNFELLPKPLPHRGEDFPWPLYPRLLKSDYGHSETKALFGKDPREFSILTKEFLSEDGESVSAIRTVRIRWEKDAAGPPRMHELPHSEEVWKADVVLLALGFLGPEKALLDAMKVEADDRTTIKAAYGSFETSRKKIFSAGDARRGQSLVVWAIHEGREAAKKIDAYLSNLDPS